jgi:hypothetical protein
MEIAISNQMILPAHFRGSSLSRFSSTQNIIKPMTSMWAAKRGTRITSSFASAGRHRNGSVVGHTNSA